LTPFALPRSPKGDACLRRRSSRVS
jgi:hypothetical protein